jgi:hypothetical protein
MMAHACGHDDENAWYFPALVCTTMMSGCWHWLSE